jgi:hypothetical protein
MVDKSDKPLSRRDPTHPKGLPLMYAYLHTTANHP